MHATEWSFGKASNGRKVLRFTIENARGMHISLVKLRRHASPRCTSLRGRTANVALSHESLKEYERGTSFLGCIVGRFLQRTAG